MGQYFMLYNLDKREYLRAILFDQGQKFREILYSTGGMMSGLAILLARGTGTGPIHGRWAGDRIALVGDYYHGKIGDVDWTSNIDLDAYYQQDDWVGISEHVVEILRTQYGMDIPPPDSAEDRHPRSILHPDGTITAVSTST